MESREARSYSERVGGYDSVPLVSILRRVMCTEVDATNRDVNAYAKSNPSLEPTTVFRGHTSVVGVSVTALNRTALKLTVLRMLTGIRRKKMFSPVLEMTRC